jgi:iron complex transport system substrate-binding protein
MNRFCRVTTTLSTLLLLSIILVACGQVETPIVEPTRTLPPSPTETPIQEVTEQPALEPTSEPMILMDGLNRQLSFTEPFQRIVSLAPSNVEILFAVGAGAQLVGRDELSDYPPEAMQVASIGSTYGILNTEAIVALEPDLVLAAGTTPPEQVQTLEDLGMTVFLVPNPMDFEGLYEDIRIAGILTGHEQQALALVDSLKARIDGVIERVAEADRVSVYYEVDGEVDPNNPWTTGSGTFQELLISTAAGINIASDLVGWQQISLEELIIRDPQVMIYEAGPWVTTTLETILARPGWSAISAVANGEIYPIDSSWVGRPGPRLVDALEAIAVILHPELFE